MTDRYAVVGNPVAHSRSPFIHAEFARQTAQDITYERILAPLEGFRIAVEDFRGAGGKGVNVTVPFKLEAFALAGERSQRAQDAQAVNVLRFEGATLFGDNTDGIGLVRDIQANLGIGIEGRAVLLMGAGGAAQGALGPLLGARPGRLVVANRTLEKAQRLVERASVSSASVQMCASTYADLRGDEFDLVINATAASLNNVVPDLPPAIFAKDAVAYDMMYGTAPTPFLALAMQQGAAQLADGLGMLVEQAAESFFIWRGIRPQTGPVIDALRSQ